MAEYTLNELTDMHLLYGETRGNSRATRRLYAERFPMWRLPSHDLMFCFNELMPIYMKLDTWDQPDEELGGLPMYDATCRSEWIVNANILTVLIVASLR